jgi:hypothetical protein
MYGTWKPERDRFTVSQLALVGSYRARKYELMKEEMNYDG